MRRRGWTAAALLLGFLATDATRADEIDRILDRKVDLYHSETTLSGFLRTAGRKTGLPITIHPEVVAQGKEMEVNVQLKGIRLRHALGCVLTSMGLQFRKVKGLVIVGKPTVNQDDAVLRSYDTRGLFPTGSPAEARLTDPVGPVAGPRIREQHLEPRDLLAQVSQIIRSRIAPNSWGDVGASIRQVEGRLIVRNTPAVQERVARFLSEIRSSGRFSVLVRGRLVTADRKLFAGETLVLSAAGRARLEKALLEENATLLRSFSLTCSSNRWEAFSSITTTAYPADYDVQVAQNSRTLDPVVRRLLEGTEVLFKPLVAHDGGRIRLSVVVRRVRRVATRTVKTKAGPIELPEVARVRLSTTVNVPDRATIVLPLPGATSSGRIRVLVAQVRAHNPFGRIQRTQAVKALQTSPFRKQLSARLVDLDFLSTPLLEAVGHLHRISGVNFHVPPPLRGHLAGSRATLTLQAKRISVARVFELLRQTHGIHSVEIPGPVLVLTRRPHQRDRSRLRLYYIADFASPAPDRKIEEELGFDRRTGGKQAGAAFTLEYTRKATISPEVVLTVVREKMLAMGLVDSGDRVQLLGDRIVIHAPAGVHVVAARLIDGLRAMERRNVSCRVRILRVDPKNRRFIAAVWRSGPVLSKRQLEALLGRARSEPGVHEVSSYLLTGLNHLVFNGVDLLEQHYLADYDVQVAQGTWIWDPWIGRVLYGSGLEVEPHVIEAGRDKRLIRVRLRHLEARGAPSLRTVAHRSGPIHYPVVKERSSQVRFVAPDGGGYVWFPGRFARDGSGDLWVAVARVEVVEAK